MMCKIRCTKPPEGVFTEYQPEVGKVYDADYVPSRKRNWELFCVIDIKDKKIVLRRGEFEIVEDKRGIQ